MRRCAVDWTNASQVQQVVMVLLLVVIFAMGYRAGDKR